MMEKMKLESQDVAAQKREKLKQLFPGAFMETRNESGEVVDSVDFERLRAEIGNFSDVFESRRERYIKDWPGKKECLKLIQYPSTGTLKPDRDSSVDFDSTENIFIEGDNLQVLKLLQKGYYGKIKLIYIDPPYNTGNEFIYPDNFAESLDTYLKFAGLADSEGKEFSTNTSAEGRFHTKWLNMMFPRIYLARNLLRDDGVIFISIDDNEYVNLKAICNEVFGEENFVATVIWQKVYAPKNSAKFFSEDHDYILVYAKDAENWSPTLLPRSAEANARYTNRDDDSRGPWKAENLTARNYYGDGQYEITGPTGETFFPGRGRYWLVARKKFDDLVADNRIWWGADGSAKPSQKRFLSEIKQGTVPQTLWEYSDVGHTQDAKKELLKYVDFQNTENVLNSVKPVALMQKILKIGTRPDQQDIVLDFFAGSAPMGQATIAQNTADGGNRKFIAVQLPQELKVDEPEMKTIADMGRRRIVNYGKSVLDAESDRLPNQGLASEMADIGLRSFRLDRSNFQPWKEISAESASDEEVTRQLELSIDHVDAEASSDDILYELLLKAGFELSVPTTTVALASKTVCSVADGALLICLEEEITQELLDAVVTEDPLQFICLDRAFKGNDQLKANAVQTFAARNQGRDKTDQIIFRTV